MKLFRLFLIGLWCMAMSCATQTTPMGGPKDTIPPTVTRYSPKQNQTNFHDKEVVVEFSEPVVLNNPKDEIIIIPSVGKKTDFRLKGTSLIIEPENPWKDTTTYNINFREGVKDLTEGNVAKDKSRGDIHLAFSTGPTIDTLSISGKVKNGFDEKIPENITIALYTSDTFNIFEDIPEYFTKSNKQGNFSITNLKANKYKLYAFDDKNKNLKAETRTEKFGFSSKTIELDSAVSNLEIAMVNIDSRKPKITSSRNQSDLNTIRFNKSMTNYEVVVDTPLTSSFASNQTEIIAYYPLINIDSIQVRVKAIDSTMQKVDTLIYIKKNDNERIKESFKMSTGDATYNIETNLFTFSMSFNKPIMAMNPDSLYIRYDSATILPLKFKSLKYDTIFNKISVSEIIPIDSLPKSLGVTVAPAYLVSIEGDSSKKANASLRLLDSPTTAVLFVNVQTTQPHFIIQLVNGQNKVVQEVVDRKQVTFKYLAPESVKIRAIIDTNGNGVWDSAIYSENREPERIIYYLNSERKLETPLRANWEVGPLLFRF
ncbi:MAG TPA: Ig-like domain-containing protein [Cyclobacteriaceae bacterium]